MMSQKEFDEMINQLYPENEATVQLITVVGVVLILVVGIYFGYSH